jgi:hypothetical protein
MNLRYAEPAGTLFIKATFAIPVKLSFHPAEFVGIDFFSRRSGNDSRLRPLNDWLSSVPSRPEDNR